jgi:hypothetical protein
MSNIKIIPINFCGTRAWSITILWHAKTIVEIQTQQVTVRPFLCKEEIMSLQKLLDELEVLKVEYEKFERGNKSAGTRARKSLQNVKKISQEIRNHIQEAKKTEE